MYSVKRDKGTSLKAQAKQMYLRKFKSEDKGVCSNSNVPHDMCVQMVQMLKLGLGLGHNFSLALTIFLTHTSSVNAEVHPCMVSL